MQIINGLEELPDFSKKSAVAIGNFDGVHLGHKRILEVLVEEARKNNLVSVVLTFSPHPKTVVGKESLKMIQSLDQRLASIGQFHVEAALILRFDEKLASHTAEEFIRNLVLAHLNAEAVIVGKNFCFGQNRQGCSETLYSLAARYKFRIRTIPSVIIEEIPVSSSLIRKFLQQGKIEQANILLGKPYEIEGAVIKGKSRGKNLGFPTANIQSRNEIVPEGVYLSITVIGGTAFPSLTNVGKCPTFVQLDKNVESYVLNFNDDIYGQEVSVRFLKKIRNERKFTSPQELAGQIRKDLQRAKDYFRLS